MAIRAKHRILSPLPPFLPEGAACPGTLVRWRR
jgi:hypothetical protein